MKYTSNEFVFLRFLGKLVKWYLLIMIPMTTCFLIYVSTAGGDFDSMSNGDMIKLIPHIAKEILSFYPFADTVAKFLSKSFTVNTITMKKLIDDIIKGLITFGLVDLGKYFFNVTKDTATTDTKLKHWAKLILIYGLWVILFSYVAGLVTDKGFKWLELNVADEKTWFAVKVVLLLAFFVISVAKFSFLTKEKMLLCVAWVLNDKILFSILSSLCLTFFSMWTYRKLFGTGTVQWGELIVPLLFYVLFAAGIDALKWKARNLIVRVFK